MTGEIDQGFGSVIEGVHLAGYSFERAMRKLEWLLTDERWKTIGNGFGDVNAFVDSIRLDNFKMIAEQRKTVVALIKKAMPEASNRQIAKVVGVNPSTIDEDAAAGNPADGKKKPKKAKGGSGGSAGNPAHSLSGAAAASKVLDKPRGTQGTGENEWYTPADVVSDARKVLGVIDLDPASSVQAQSAVQALQYFTLDDDGLKRMWHGNVWLNPPYAQPHIEDFADKMILEIKACRVSAAIMLTHNYTDTAWFQKLAAASMAICFPRGRIRFEAPDGTLAAPTQGQAFFYFGKDAASFSEVFGPRGFVVGALV